MEIFFSFSDKTDPSIFSIIEAKEHPSIISIGSITFPFDFDIFSPFSALTILWSKTVLKGTYPVSIKLIIAILATQKNNISYPVSKIVFGNNSLYSGSFSFGHPAQEKGNKAEENQVSRTSSS